MIRDQLIEHTNNVKVGERLLLERDELLLSEAVAVAFDVESAAECAATLTAHVATSSRAVSSDHALYPPPPPHSNSVTATGPYAAVMQLGGRQRPRPQTQTQQPCGNCGSQSHA